jgi:predicted phage terminase large subunit-like protein
VSATLEKTADGTLAVGIGFSAPSVVKAFVEDRTFITGYFGPLGCAKTSAGAIKSWCYGEVYPGARILVTRSTWPELRDTTQKTYFDWLPEGVVGHYEVTNKTYWIPGHRADLPGARLHRRDRQRAVPRPCRRAPGRAAGATAIRADGSLVVEPGIALDLHRAILGRLGRQKGYPGRLWMTGNPPPPSHWIAKEFGYEPGSSGCDPPRNRREDCRLYLGDQETNRQHLPRGYYERLECLYGRAPPMARRYVKGQWIEFGTAKPFRAEWITYWGEPGERPPEGLLIEAGFDPAISKRDTAARSALVVAGQVQRGQDRGVICVLEVVAGHWSVYEQVDRILKAVRRWKLKRVRIENVAYQKALAEILVREQRIAGLMFHVDEVEPDADKLRRANAWSPLVEDGTVRFGPGQEDLVQSMLAVPDDKGAWDLVDAAGICVRGFQMLQPESQRLPWAAPLSSPARAISYVANPPQAGARHRASPPCRSSRSGPRDGW